MKAALGIPKIYAQRAYQAAAAMPDASLYGKDEEAYWTAVRKPFLIPEDEVYLNNGTVGSSPLPVLKAIVDCYHDAERMAQSDPEDYPIWGYAAWNEFRDPLAKFIGCNRDELALLRNATEANSYIANDVDLKAGDEVLITDQEHPGGEHPWDLRAKRYGIMIKKITLPKPTYQDLPGIMARPAWPVNPTMTILPSALRVLLPVLGMVWIFRQVRKPSGPLGKRVVRAMNLSHATMTEWALQQVTVPKNAAILDVGCGGGRTVARLAALAPEGKVFGLDCSAASVAVSRDTNAREVETGRVQIEQASVAALPFPDCTFDIVTAVETHYYWPDLPANVREVLRVLRAGGTFALIAETYRGGPLRLLYGIVMPLLRAAFLSDAEHRDLLTQAGFAEVATKHLPGKNWICATGRRPT